MFKFMLDVCNDVFFNLLKNCEKKKPLSKYLKAFLWNFFFSDLENFFKISIFFLSLFRLREFFKI